MSEEARKLVDDFDDAVVRCAETAPDDRREFKDAHAKWSAAQHALLAFIERIERELEEARANYAFMVDRAAQREPTLDGYRELGAKCAQLEQKLDEAQRSRDQYRNDALGCTARIAELERERDEAREILAHTDIGSLPNDWTLKQVAEARINDLMKFRDQVRDTCARAEKAEAENARLRQISTQRGAKIQLLREYFTTTEWDNIVGIRPEAAAWFDSDGVPIDAARKL